MAIKQFEEYFSNQDFTVISRRTFEGEKDNLYPVISICLYGGNGQVFRSPHAIKDSSKRPMCRSCKNELSGCISNNTNMIRCGPIDFFRAMSGMIENIDITTLPFDWLTYDAQGLVLDHRTKTKEGKVDYRLKKMISKGNVSGLVRHYHDAKHVCIQKARHYESSKILRYQFWKISIYEMASISGQYDIRIFVHQKGQLLRNLGAPTFVLDNHFIKNKKRRFENRFTYKIDLQVNAVDVLHKRKDSFEACDDSLYEEDTVWIQNAIRLLNCTPSFMDHMKSSVWMDKNRQSNETCNKKMLQEFHSNYEPEFNFARIAESYDQPCNETESTVTSTAATISKADVHVGFAGDLAIRPSDRASDVELTLHFKTQHYKLASNDKSFTLLTLWSQIGGFIGIFLGYSLLQLPELLGCAVTRIRRFIDNLKILYHSNEPQQSEIN